MQLRDVQTTLMCSPLDILLSTCSSGEISTGSLSKDSKNLIMFFLHFTLGELTMEGGDMQTQ